MSEQETRVPLPTSSHTSDEPEEESLQLSFHVISEGSREDEISELLTTQEMDSKQTFLPRATGSL